MTSAPAPRHTCLARDYLGFVWQVCATCKGTGAVRDDAGWGACTDCTPDTQRIAR